MTSHSMTVKQKLTRTHSTSLQVVVGSHKVFPKHPPAPLSIEKPLHPSGWSLPSWSRREQQDAHPAHPAPPAALREDGQYQEALCGLVPLVQLLSFPASSCKQSLTGHKPRTHSTFPANGFHYTSSGREESPTSHITCCEGQIRN